MSDVSQEFTAHSPSAIDEISSLREVLVGHFQPAANDGQTWVHQLEDATIIEVRGGNNDTRPSKTGTDLKATATSSVRLGSWVVQVLKTDYSENGHHEEEFGIMVVGTTGRMMAKHREVDYFESNSESKQVTKNNESTEQIRISNLEEMRAFIGSSLHLIGLERVN